jgi:hypothetical protein
MTTLSYHLEPFPDGLSPGIAIVGRIVRDFSALTVEVELGGDLGEVVLEGTGESPARRHGLWEGTCLELFLAPGDSPVYWEFNLSSAGHWNVYRFSDYRQEMREEEAFGNLPFKFHRKPGSLVLAMEIDLAGIIHTPQSLDAAVCALVKHRGGPMSYWALTHCGPRPDFHRRESFILAI